MLSPSPRQLIPRMTLPGPRRSFRIFSFTFFFCSFSFLLWQLAIVYNVLLFLCLMKRFEILLHESLISLQYLSMIGVVISMPSDET